ncbi:hypothetical protein Tco_1173347 [Tanacetum coccineum]
MDRWCQIHYFSHKLSHVKIALTAAPTIYQSRWTLQQTQSKFLLRDLLRPVGDLLRRVTPLIDLAEQVFEAQLQSSQHMHSAGIEGNWLNAMTSPGASKENVWNCLVEQWKSALGTSLSEDVRGCDVVIIDGSVGGHLVFLIGERISQNSIDRQRGRGCGRSRDDSERVERDAMLHVTGVVNIKMGLAREDFGCDRGGGRMSGKGRDGSKEGA